MAENIPPGDLPPTAPSDSGDSPPEPDSSNSTTSTRALRGSPVPPTVSSGQVTDPVPDPFSATGTSPPAPVLPVPSSLPSTLDTVPSLPDLTTPSSDRPQEVPSSTSAAHPVDPEGLQVSGDLLSTLLDLGFDEYIARIALLRTNNHGVEAAVQWIVERSNESDFEESGGEEEVMGASNSAGPVLSMGGRTHKMVLVANTSLKMGTGKLAAQVGHATLAVYRTAVATEEGKQALEAWRRHGEVKIVVKGESTEQLMDLLKNAKEAGLFAYIIQDAGYTQIPPGSRTVLGVFGPVEKVDEVTGHLKLL